MLVKQTNKPINPSKCRKIIIKEKKKIVKLFETSALKWLEHTGKKMTTKNSIIPLLWYLRRNGIDLVDLSPTSRLQPTKSRSIQRL